MLESSSVAKRIPIAFRPPATLISNAGVVRSVDPNKRVMSLDLEPWESDELTLDTVVTPTLAYCPLTAEIFICPKTAKLPLWENALVPPLEILIPCAMAIDDCGSA